MGPLIPLSNPARPQLVVHRAPAVRLPANHVRLNVSGHTYYYDAGAFYRHGSSGYVAVAAPDEN